MASRVHLRLAQKRGVELTLGRLFGKGNKNDPDLARTVRVFIDVDYESMVTRDGDLDEDFNPQYSNNFRHQIVELVRSGRKPQELAKEFGCSIFSIMKWVRRVEVSL